MSKPTQAMNLLTSNATPHWLTPYDPLIRLTHVFLGQIDLDPASHPISQQWIKATITYTSRGLTLPWFGKFWLNCPWGMGEDGIIQHTSDWMNKAETEIREDRAEEGVAIVNSAQGYNWYELLCDRRPVIQLRARTPFICPDLTRKTGAAKKGQTLICYSDRVEEFVKIFGHLGRFIHQGHLI